MKKLLLIVLAAGLLFSCQKQSETPQLQEISFNAIQITPNSGLKSTADWICKTDVPDHAYVVISGETYNPLVFELDGKLYTQSIKFPVGTYCVEEFILYKEVSGDGFDPLVDIAVYGTPLVGSDYAVYVDKALGLDDNDDCVFFFDVVAFTKAELDIQVLCYLDADYDAFGFDWFAVTEIVIREQCFFGDFCIKHPEAYRGSNYFLQSTWPDPVPPFIDAPAIIKVHVSKYNSQDNSWTAVPYSPFTNNTLDADYGVGAPVCIQYPDNLSITGETFKVVLEILVKQGNTFVFLPFWEDTFVDDEMLVLPPPDSDGVIDFVLGSCNDTPTDIQLAPWQDLPETANVQMVHNPTDDTYWDITFNSYYPDETYDLPPAPVTLGGWCGDANTTISGLPAFTAYIYSSLIDDGWVNLAGMPFGLEEIATVNWLMNHLGDYGFTPSGPGTGGAVGPVQQAVWKLLNGTYNSDPIHPKAIEMYNDAVGQTGFVPLPGGWAAVLIIKDNDPDTYQLVFVVVDP